MGMDDDSPWDEYFESDLPALCGGQDKALEVLHRIQSAPTLAALVQAVG